MAGQLPVQQLSDGKQVLEPTVQILIPHRTRPHTQRGYECARHEALTGPRWWSDYLSGTAFCEYTRRPSPSSTHGRIRLNETPRAA